MLTFSALESLLAATSPREFGEVAKSDAIRASPPVRRSLDGANSANLVTGTSAANSQISLSTRPMEASANTGSEPLFASSHGSHDPASSAENIDPMIVAARAVIQQSPLTTEQRESRFADLASAPELAQFWLIVWGTESMDLPIDFGKIRKD